MIWLTLISPALSFAAMNSFNPCCKAFSKATMNKSPCGNKTTTPRKTHAAKTPKIAQNNLLKTCCLGPSRDLVIKKLTTKQTTNELTPKKITVGLLKKATISKKGMGNNQ